MGEKLWGDIDAVVQSSGAEGNETCISGGEGSVFEIREERADVDGQLVVRASNHLIL